MQKDFDRFLGILLCCIYIFIAIGFLSTFFPGDYEILISEDYEYSEGFISDGLPFDSEFDFGCLDQQKEER